MAAARTRRTVKMIIMTGTLATPWPRPPHSFHKPRPKKKMITEAAATNVQSGPRLSGPLRERFGEAYRRA
jgi:hypothetical protein